MGSIATMICFRYSSDGKRSRIKVQACNCNSATREITLSNSCSDGPRKRRTCHASLRSGSTAEITSTSESTHCSLFKKLFHATSRRDSTCFIMLTKWIGLGSREKSNSAALNRAGTHHSTRKCSSSLFGDCRKNSSSDSANSSGRQLISLDNRHGDSGSVNVKKNHS